MNVNHFEDEIKRQEGIIQNIDVLIAHIDNDEEFNDSLGMKYSSVSWTESITITQATFDLINDSNIGLISSDTLRNRTVHLINGLYQKESKIINNVAMEQYTGIVMPIYLEYVRFDKKGIAHISDYERFKRDPKSINLLSTRRYWKNAVIDKLNSLRKETNLVSSMIELEMELW